MIPTKALNKLLAVHFGSPVPNATEDQIAHQVESEFKNAKASLDRRAILQRLKTQLENATHATCRYHSNKKDPLDDGYVSVKIDCSHEDRSNEDWFVIKFISTGETFRLLLFDSHYRRKSQADTAVILAERQLVEFMLAVRAFQNRRYVRVKKNEKLTSFQQHGLTARLRSLSDTHGFSFAIGENIRDVLLSIRIGTRKTGFHFSFPKGKLNAVIDQIPDLIHSLTELTKLSVSFRSDNRKWADRQSPWYSAAENSENGPDNALQGRE